ncbi:MAG: aminodeoxychorismate synthase component I [Alphaproteobacteria bacterium]|nr:aminodeoxychorismate synthase component I [Alphaproteobacteria bacterium]
MKNAINPFLRELPGLDPATAFEGLQDRPWSLWLDSADRAHPRALYSYILCDPAETVEAKNGRITITTREGRRTDAQGDPFEILQNRLNARNPPPGAKGAPPLPADLPPFRGGAAGLFSYDLARGLETLPSRAADNPNLPDMAVGIYDQVLAFEHRSGKAWLLTHAATEKEASQKKKRFLTRMKSPRRALAADAGQYSPILLTSNFTKDAYKEAVSTVIAYIRAGDLFQANLAQRFEAKLPSGFDPFAHYLHLRQVNPAPFAAYMNLGEVKIASASPERFLTLRDGRAESWPIKGTMPRHADPTLDHAAAAALGRSEKDRAENIMIVDLLRNDLSKVCTPESVEVEELCALESFTGVHHLVSGITGFLQSGKTTIDLLRACFPGGSITGAPKIRALEIIEELEPTRRGPYCGALGYVGFDGSMDTSILIRTLIYDGQTVSLQAGGGITAESHPDAEYQETLDKAAAILRSFEP